MIRRLFHRYRFLKITRLLNGNSHILIAPKVEFFVNQSASVIISQGTLGVGTGTLRSVDMPSYQCSKIILMERAKLVVEGDVLISPGAYIQIGKDATLIFRGTNIIGSNAIIISNYQTIIGKNSSLSWNVCLIDDDGHNYYTSDGKRLKRWRKQMVIGDNVGIQMNVSIPSGIKVGDNSVIAAHTVVRRDVPENSLIYQNPEYIVKSNITTGFQIENFLRSPQEKWYVIWKSFTNHFLI